MVRTSVDLPAPLDPMMPNTSPSRMVRLTSSTAAVAEAVSGKLDLDVLQLYHGTTFLCDDCLVRAGLAEAGEDVVGVVDDAFERIGLHDSFHSLGEFGVGIGACTAMTL